MKDPKIRNRFKRIPLYVAGFYLFCSSALVILALANGGADWGLFVIMIYAYWPASLVILTIGQFFKETSIFYEYETLFHIVFFVAGGTLWYWFLTKILLWIIRFIGYMDQKFGKMLEEDSRTKKDDVPCFLKPEKSAPANPSTVNPDSQEINELKNE